MNRKISLGMAVTIVILAMTVTFSITMLIAMRLFDSTVSSVKEKESRDFTVHACPSLLIQQHHDHTAQQRECKHACQNKAADTQPALVFLFVHRIPDSL